MFETKKILFFLLSTLLLPGGAEGSFSLGAIKSEETYELGEEKNWIFPRKALLEERLSLEGQMVEPLYFHCPNLDLQCSEILTYFAREGEALALAESTRKLPHPKKKDWYRFEFTESSKEFLDFPKIQKKLAVKNYRLEMGTEVFKTHPEKKKQFLFELSYFFSPKELEKIERKLDRQNYLSVKNELLPPLVRSRLGHYTAYQGPNCFEAALSFQGEGFSRSYRYNIKDEPGHHELMINNDELFDLLQKHFIEVDPRENGLRYGDLLVFVDYGEALNEQDFHYSWIKHASVFLFNHYTFSKASKSADSPYSIKTLEEEWARWLKFYKFLKIKVFRKPRRDNKEFNRKKLVDWIY